MIKKLLLLLLLFNFSCLFSQNDRTVIMGLVENNSKVLEDIHVFNKNSGRGTITNSKGEFKILVKEKDTLVFSGLQFYYVEYPVDKVLFRKKYLHVNLLLKINELEEVELKAHDLLGNLATDASNVKDTVSKVSRNTLDFSMIDFSKPVILEIDEIDRTKPPDASNLTNPNIPIGGNIIGLLSLALDPLIDEIGKIGQKKRQKKHKEWLYEKKAFSAFDDIVDELGEAFFINTLKIPEEKIGDFLEHCQNKGIVGLHIKGKKIELIDTLIKERETFKE